MQTDCDPSRKNPKSLQGAQVAIHRVLATACKKQSGQAVQANVELHQPGFVILRSRQGVLLFYSIPLGHVSMQRCLAMQCAEVLPMQMNAETLARGWCQRCFSAAYARTSEACRMQVSEAQ